MSQTRFLTPELHQYLLTHSLRESEWLSELREATFSIFPKLAHKQIAPEQAQFMQWLVEVQQAKNTLDIGTFTGYSALAVALSLPLDGKVYTFDIDPVVTQWARTFWEKSGMQHKIELRLGSAVQTLSDLLAEGKTAYFDFAFIDADKYHYDEYYEQCLQLLRPGGLIVIDNVLGVTAHAITDPQVQQKRYIKSIRHLNEKLVLDQRVSLSMLPLGDGITLVRKRS